MSSNSPAKVNLELKFEDFNALDILIQQEVVRTSAQIIERGAEGALTPAMIAWRNRIRVMAENLAAMRPAGYREAIRAAHETRASVCD